MTTEQLPQDTENTKYVASSWEAEMTLYDIINLCDRFFPDAYPGDITVSHEEIQTRCFGYDLYDSSDWGWYWVFRKDQ